MLKTVVWIAGIVVLLALVWAALHDILKGEPDLSLEYGFILCSVLIIGIVLLSWLRRRGKRLPG